MTDAFATVRSGYDRLGDRYRDWSAASGVRLTFVNRLINELAPGSLVLDLGCGPGEPATRLLAEEHRVLGVDASHTQLRLARDAAPSATLVQADMTRFALRPDIVDAVASFYALGHVPSQQHAPLFRSIAEWLRPGGLLLTSAPLLVGDEVDQNWLGVPMYFGGIGEPATRRAVEDAGLVVEEWQRVKEDEGEGNTVTFLWLLARKPEAVGGPTSSPATSAHTAPGTDFRYERRMGRPGPASPSGSGLEAAVEEGGDGVPVGSVQVPRKAQQLREPPKSYQRYVDDAAASEPRQLGPYEAKGASDWHGGSCTLKLPTDGVDLREKTVHESGPQRTVRRRAFGGGGPLLPHGAP